MGMGRGNGEEFCKRIRRFVSTFQGVVIKWWGMVRKEGGAGMKTKEEVWGERMNWSFLGKAGEEFWELLNGAAEEEQEAGVLDCRGAEVSLYLIYKLWGLCQNFEVEMREKLKELEGKGEKQ